VIRVIHKRCENLLEPTVHLLLIRRQVGPRLDTGVGRRQDGVFRDDADRFLPLEGLLANLVPALVELPLVLGDEILRGVQRGMGGADR